jgi:hypothetical protein
MDRLLGLIINSSVYINYQLKLNNVWLINCYQHRQVFHREKF